MTYRAVSPTTDAEKQSAQDGTPVLLDLEEAHSAREEPRTVLPPRSICFPESKSDGSELSNKSRIVFQWIDELGY